ncbi:MAG TPA: site-specific DNA-methyltransferase [Thermomicrobiales bacterium]|nr:site-specific DNA-methyltransferase [Thermomicrobiales bacterium]
MNEPATWHKLIAGDARDLSFIPDESVQLVVTSPPYWNLKEYPEARGQIGNMADYEAFLTELDKVWAHCARVLIPGGRVCCVVGDVCVSRRKGGRHFVMPLPADIQVRSRRFGFDNLTPIIWLKVANIQMEASKSSRFLGKPYLPNGVIKNDFETILMLRKPALGGKRGYRSPTPEMEEASRIGKDEYFKWFRAIWDDVRGASLRNHPAPYPKELAYRLVRMFSFAGDTVLDPFVGTGTTTLAAIDAGRNSIGVEVDPGYFTMARRNIETASHNLWGTTTFTIEDRLGRDHAPAAAVWESAAGEV